MRSSLFLKFTKQFIKASAQLDVSSKKPKPGSISYNLLKCKSLALNSAKNKVMETMILVMDNFGNSYQTMNINRNQASVFAVDKKVDHEGTVTIFG